MRYERIALRNARRRMLEFLKTKHVLNTMFNLEYILADLSFERNLEEQLKDEQKHRRAAMKKLSKHSG